MKIRVTLMTENDKHIPVDKINDEELLKKTKQGWDLLLAMINAQGNESSVVENIEIVER